MRRSLSLLSCLLLAGAALLLLLQAAQPAHAFAPAGAPLIGSARRALLQQPRRHRPATDVHTTAALPPLPAAASERESAAEGLRQRGPLAAWVGRMMGRRQQQHRGQRAVAPLRASLTPEQEAKRYQITRQVQELDELIQAKAEAKRAIDKEIDGLLAQKRSLQLEVNTLAPSLELASESPLRSLVKACSWRFVAALITLSTSLFFSGDAKMAASIVGSDFLSKAGTMYIGERMWNKVNWGKEAKAGDAASRSIMKAFAWRAFAMINTLIISLFFAKNVKIAGQIASTDTIVKTSLYIVHERIWAKVDWGRSYDVEYQI